MTVDNFIVRITSKYSRELDEYSVRDVRDWVVRMNFTPDDIDEIYNVIARTWKYKTFPPLSAFISAWESIAPDIMSQRHWVQSFQNSANLSPREIHARYVQIMKNPRTNSEIEFLHQWSDLYSIYEFAVSAGWAENRIESYCEKIKQAIIHGETVSVQAAHQSICGTAPKTQHCQFIDKLCHESKRGEE